VCGQLNSMSTNGAQGRKRKAPARYMDLSPSTDTDVLKQKIQKMEDTLLDSEMKLKQARDLLSISECLRTEAEIEISRNMRLCAEWRALYYNHSARGLAFQSIFLNNLRSQHVANK
jgi:hypothetical protein